MPPFVAVGEVRHFEFGAKFWHRRGSVAIKMLRRLVVSCFLVSRPSLSQASSFQRPLLVSFFNMIDIVDSASSSGLLPAISKRKTTTALAESNMLPLSSSSPSSPPPPLRIQLLSDKATLPTKGSIHSAGWDLYSAVDIVIPKQSRALIPLDISIACPPNTYARIAPRSGLALKHGIHVGAGVVDADYRGPVSVLLFNMDEHKDFEVKQGDRIAQCILEYVCMTTVMQVESLDDTERGSGGFGSTGVSKEETSEVSSSPKKAKTVDDDAEIEPSLTESSSSSSDDTEESNGGESK